MIIIHIFPVHETIIILDSFARLGDIKEYDCALGYKSPEVTVQWIASVGGKKFNDPLILTASQSIKNTWYTCNITINTNPGGCLPHPSLELSITVNGNVININVYIFHCPY